MKDGSSQKVGSGRGTAYIKNSDYDYKRPKKTNRLNEDHQTVAFATNYRSARNLMLKAVILFGLIKDKASIGHRFLRLILDIHTLPVNRPVNLPVNLSVNKAK